MLLALTKRKADSREENKICALGMRNRDHNWAKILFRSTACRTARSFTQPTVATWPYEMDHI